MDTSRIVMGKREIKKVIPHRWPFLFVKRVFSIDGESITAEVSYPLLFWLMIMIGHFPGNPVGLGALTMEAAAQVAAVLLLSRPEFKGKIPFFVKAEVAWRVPIKPFQKLYVKVDYKGERKGLYDGSALVTLEDGTKAASLELLRCTLSDPAASRSTTV